MSRHPFYFILPVLFVSLSGARAFSNEDVLHVVCASADFRTHIDISFSRQEGDRSIEGLRADEMVVIKGAPDDAAGLRRVADFFSSGGGLNNSDDLVVGYTSGHEAREFANVRSVMVDIAPVRSNGQRSAQVIITDLQGGLEIATYTCNNSY